jgi:hypothetical protein
LLMKELTKKKKKKFYNVYRKYVFKSRIVMTMKSVIIISCTEE